MRIIYLLQAFLLTTSALVGQQPDIRQFDSVLNAMYQTKRFNGTALYAENGKVLYKKAFGVDDYRTGKPLSTTSSFNLASVTKQFVCMGILILHDRGKLNIDDPVKKFIPELPYDSISIRNLMTHTSGITEYFDLFNRWRTPLDTLDNEKLIALFAETKPPLEFKTGSSWNYCNTNYALLVSIIERISRQSFHDFFYEQIAKPLQLNDTYVYHVGLPEVPKNHVYGFSGNGMTNKLNDLTAFDGVTGDGNIYSSVEDLLKWEQSLYTEKLVKKQTLAMAFEPVKLNDGSTYHYGFGWGIEKDRPGEYSHTGGWVGFGNVIYRNTQRKSVVIVLSSGSNALCIRAARNFIQQKNQDISETLLIKNVRIADGTGAPIHAGAVRIQAKRIIAVGNLQPYEGEKTIDGGGKLLAPGFIDSHSHLFGSLERYPEALAALSQGITTIISGQDGSSDPVDSLQAAMQRIPPAINVATFTGHASIREKVMGEANLSRPATAAELEKIKVLLQEDLRKGSLGLSTGLEYEAGFYSNRHEVIELAKVAAAEKGRYVSHLRSEDVHMEEAIDEIINIGTEAGLPVQISHIKLALRDDWGSAATLLAQLQKARARGIDITADCYPYDFWNSTIRVLFPQKNFTSLAGAQYAVDHLFDPAGSVITRFAPDTSYKGKTVSAIAALRRETPAQTLLYLVAAADEYRKQHPDEGGVEGIMGKSMSEDDIRSFLAWSFTGICSDGSNGGHPRGWGSFTRVLRRYVTEQKLLRWEEAIHKMTAFSAAQSGLVNRGTIAPGYFADLVLIDTETVKDNASIQNPKAMSDGILRVWVNGEMVFENKQFAGRYPGEFLRRN